MVRLLLSAVLAVPQPVRAAEVEPTFRHEPLKKLLADLKDKDPMVRRMAATTLGMPDGSEGKGGPRPRGDLWPAMLALVDAQQDKDMQVRANAMKSLGLLMRYRGVPEKAEERWEKIELAAIAALKDPEDLVKAAAAGALPLIGIETKPGLAALHEAFKSDDAKVRAAAADGARGVRPITNIVPTLAVRLKDSDAAVRLASANTLIAARGEAAGALKALVAAVKDDDAKVAVSAATALGNIGTGAAAAVPALVDAVHDPKGPARNAAVTALGSIQRQPDLAVPALIHALSVDALRADALNALARLGEQAGEAAPAVMAFSRDGKGVVNASALYVLAAIEPDGHRFFEVLFAAAQDPNPNVRNLALNYFHKGYPEALPFLATWFQADPAVRNRLASVFGSMGAAARPVVPMMVELIGNLETNPTLRRMLVNAVNRIDPAILKTPPDDM